MVLRIAKGKGEKDRYVMLSPKLLAILRDWWKVERPRHWLFPGERPEAPITRAAVQRTCQIAAQRARLAKAVSPHALRVVHCACGSEDEHEPGAHGRPGRTAAEWAVVEAEEHDRH